MIGLKPSCSFGKNGFKQPVLVRNIPWSLFILFQNLWNQPQKTSFLICVLPALNPSWPPTMYGEGLTKAQKRSNISTALPQHMQYLLWERACLGSQTENKAKKGKKNTAYPSWRQWRGAEGETTVARGSVSPSGCPTGLSRLVAVVQMWPMQLVWFISIMSSFSSPADVSLKFGGTGNICWEETKMRGCRGFMWGAFVEPCGSHRWDGTGGESQNEGTLA